LPGILGLYLSPASLYFGGVQAEPSEAEVVVAGLPYDSTSSYRPGTRFAPAAIRQAAANIEFYSPRKGIDIEHVKIHDFGDVVVVTDARKQLDIIARVVGELLGHYRGATPVFIGGEHTVTYGIVRGLAGVAPSCLLVLDAHLDMRSEYMGDPYSHACVVRRIAEDGLAERIVVVGTRAYVKEEAVFAHERGIPHIDSLRIIRGGVGVAIDEVKRMLKECSGRLHISIDMDVYDPAYAPGVGNPEPEGLTPTHVFDILHVVVGEALNRGLALSLDVVEANPLVDSAGITSVLAAKTIVEFIAALVSRTKNMRG